MLIFSLVLDPFADPFSNKEAKNGEPLVLRCQIPNTEPLKLRSVRWSKKDFHYADLLPPLEKAPYHTVGKNGDLYFSYVTSADTGSYVCVVGNTLLGKSEERTVKLKVGFSQGKELKILLKQANSKTKLKAI